MLYAVAMLDYAGEDTKKLWLDVAELYGDAERRELLIKPWETKVRLYDDENKRLFDTEFTGLKSIVYYSVINPLGVKSPHVNMRDQVLKLQDKIPLAKEIVNIENLLKLDGKGGALFLYRRQYCSTNVIAGLTLTSKLSTGGLSDVTMRGNKVLYPFQIIQDEKNYSLKVVNILTGEEQVTQDIAECVENETYVVYKALLNGTVIDSMVVSRGYTIMSSYFITEVGKELCKYDYDSFNYGTGRELMARCIAETPLYNVQYNTRQYLSLARIGGKVGSRLAFSSRRVWDTYGDIVTAKDGVLIPFKYVGDKQVLAIDIKSNKRACGVVVDRLAWNLEYWADKGFRMMDGSIFTNEGANSSEIRGTAEYSNALALFGLKRSSITVGENGYLNSIGIINDMLDLRGVPGLRLQNKCLNIGTTVGERGYWLLIDKNLVSINGSELLSTTTSRVNVVVESSIDPDILFTLVKSLTAQVSDVQVYINLKAMDFTEIASLVYSCISLIVDIDIHCFIADTQGNFESDRSYRHGDKRGMLDFVENSFKLKNREGANKTVNYQYHITGKETLCSQIMELGIVLGVLERFEKSTTRTVIGLDTTALIYKEAEFTSMESLLVSSLSERSLAINDRGQVLACKYSKSKDGFYSLYKLLISAIHYTADLKSKTTDDLYNQLRKSVLLLLVSRLSSFLKGLSEVPINSKSASGTKYSVSCVDVLGIRVDSSMELGKLHDLQQYLYTIIQEGEEVC